MTVDRTLTFAARRSVPVRYNRDLLASTLKAMKRVGEIRQRRERVFYKQRMAGNKLRQKMEDRRLVEENSHLLPKNQLEAVTGEVERIELDQARRVAPTPAIQMKRKQRLLVGGGVEEDVEMD